jgi:transcriptional regulator with XRE-family HTH domain
MLPPMEDATPPSGGFRGSARVVPQARSADGSLRLHSFHMRKGSDEPTEFGYFVMRKMAAHDPPLTQAELARRTGMGQATISRWIFSPGRPNPEKLKLLATSLGVDYSELLTIAGYGEPASDVAEALASIRPDMDKIAVELAEMLAESSALSGEDRAFLRHTVDRLIDPYRRTVRRRRSAS